MRATKMFIFPLLLILASACGGQDGSPDTGNDDRPIVESTLPPTQDAGMVPETDAGTTPAPDAETPVTCDVPATLKDGTRVLCADFSTSCTLQWDTENCEAKCWVTAPDDLMFSRTSRDGVVENCHPTN